MDDLYILFIVVSISIMVSAISVSCYFSAYASYRDANLCFEKTGHYSCELKSKEQKIILEKK